MAFFFCDHIIMSLIYHCFYTNCLTSPANINIKWFALSTKNLKIRICMLSHLHLTLNNDMFQSSLNYIWFRFANPLHWCNPRIMLHYSVASYYIYIYIYIYIYYKIDCWIECVYNFYNNIKSFDVFLRCIKINVIQ